MISIGARVEKTNSKPNDGHQDGARATVIEVLPGTPELPEGGYFVMWDDFPLPVFVAGFRLREVKEVTH